MNTNSNLQLDNRKRPIIQGKTLTSSSLAGHLFRLLFILIVLTLSAKGRLWHTMAVSLEAPSALPLPFLCFATHDNGTTVFESTNAQAVRDAIAAASAGDRIKIAGTCAGVTTEGGTTQVARPTVPLTLEGGYTTGNWNNADPVANPTVLDAEDGGRVLYITTAVTLTNLQIRKGHAESYGGGILVEGAAGALTVQSSEFRGNYAGSFGGAIELYGVSANIQNSSFYNNKAETNGGAIDSIRLLTITNSTFQSNTAGHRGGAIYNYLGTAYLRTITVTNNSSAGYGGGISNDGGSLALINSTVMSNSANDRGGGLNLFLSVDNVIGVTNTVFARNSAGGGIGNALAMGYTGTVQISHVTISGNANNLPSGSAIEVSDSVSVTIRNTIIAHHPIGIRKNAGSLMVYEDYNTFYHLPTANQIGAVVNGGHSVREDPIFIDTEKDNYDLANSSSSAVDAGTNLRVTSDILGRLRPQGQAPDIGAYELEPVATATATATGTPTELATATPTATSTTTNTEIAPSTATPTATNLGTEVPTFTPTATETDENTTNQNYLPLVIILPTSTTTPTPLPRWQRMDNNGEVSVTSLAIAGEQLFVGTRDGSQGLYQRNLVTCQQGQRLMPVALGGASTVLGIVFQGAEGIVAAFGNHLYYSNDSGQTWKQTGQNIRAPRAVAIAGNHNFYAGDESNGIYRSVNGGVDWRQQIKDPKVINQLRLDNLDVNSLWIATNNTGVWKLTVDLDRLIEKNEGLSGASLEVWDFAFDRTNIYIATGDGIFYRGDRSSSWQRFGSGLSAIKIYSLEIVNNQFLYAGTRNMGVWRRPLDNSREWEVVSTTGWNNQSTVRDLLYDDQFCRGLLATTEAGIWLYR